MSDLLASNQQASSSALAALGNAVESAVSDEARVSTPSVDVFVRENLFPVAISSAKRRLEVAAREERGMVAWGNTNTQVSLSIRPSAYISPIINFSAVVEMLLLYTRRNNLLL